jgi:drug/metabolite transporter (DMT)-like permease
VSAPPSRGFTIGVVLGASLAFATSAPLSKLVAPMDPIFLATVRVAVAATLLSLVNLRSIARTLRSIDPRSAAKIALGGVLLGGHFGLFQWGLAETSLPAAVAFVALEPVSVVLAAWLVFGLRPSRLEGLGVGVATLGALLVGSEGLGSAVSSPEHSLFGDALVCGAVALFGFYVAAARAVRGQVPAGVFAPLVYAIAAITLATWMVASSTIAAPDVASLSTRQLAGLAALALIPTVIGHTLVQVGARVLRPSVVSLVCPGETLGSTALGVVALGAIPSTVEATGAVVILSGALVTVFSAKRTS